MPLLHSITLKDMRFHVLVGVLPHEETYPQPLEIDVTVWVRSSPPPAARSALDYRELYAAVADAVNAAPIGYLEDLAERTAEAVFLLPPVARLRIAARKPHVALPGPLAWAEVCIERDRGA